MPAVPVPELRAYLPELIILIWACAVLLLDLALRRRQHVVIAAFSLVGVIAALLSCIPLAGVTLTTFSGMYALDDFSLFFKVLFLLVVALTILISPRYLAIEAIPAGEYYSLVLFSSIGMMIMASGVDLLAIYIGLELMSLSIYALAGFVKRDPKSIEAALKYFLMGSFSSGILLYGLALLYGLTGTTQLAAMAEQTAAVGMTPVLVLAIVLLVGGFGFKIAAVPFHMWAPDVYEGAPHSVVGFISVGSKAAAFAGVMRIFLVALEPSKAQWEPLLWAIAVLSMLIGTVVAIAQSNIKRMLAYSSIASAGYMLIGIIAGTEVGLSSVLVYAMAYAFMNIGAFALVVLLCRRGERGDTIEEFTGLARISPVASASLVIFFLSLTGIPPTAGFVGKFYLFASAIQTGYIGLAVVGVVSSAISLYYYFSVVMSMYMQEAPKEHGLSPTPGLAAALLLMVAGTLIFGIFPGPLIDAAKAAVSVFLM
ncbi:MAG TPA: NADH-quinone oxidoreductase subunit N [Alphaproteobacteria bacterium]|nr:NADH-quinone oxidoreductase subunit N [Alphaproteobacteria bacterium]